MQNWQQLLSGFERITAVLQEGLVGAFLPKPEEVTPDYWEYTKWRATHRLCSAVLQNFATQVGIVCRFDFNLVCHTACK